MLHFKDDSKFTKQSKANSVKAKKAKPKSEYFELAKSGKNLLVTLVKEFGKKPEKRQVVITEALQKKIKALKSGDIETFKKLCYPFCRVQFLACDSKARKMGLSKSSRPRYFYNVLANELDRQDLAVYYGKK